jgi:hypothetical protein
MFRTFERAATIAAVATVVLGSGASTSFALSWDAQFATLRTSDVCNRIGMPLGDFLNNCRAGGAGAVCDYELRPYNNTRTNLRVTITVGALPQGWQVYPNGQYFSSILKPYESLTAKLFRPSADRPSRPVQVSVECGATH